MGRGLVGDLKYAARQLARQRGFAATAILSLALGIGLNTTLFSAVYGVLLRPTAIANPERLVEIYSGPNQDFPQLTNSYPDYLDIKRGADAFSGVAANAYVRGILATGQRGVMVTGEAVTSNYFDVLGIRPSLGRAFRPDEEGAPGASSIVVLSHALWQQRFGGTPGVVGSEAQISGRKYTVVGVAPRGFTGTIPGIPTDFWVPVTMVESFVFSGVQWSSDRGSGTNRLERRGLRWLFVKGRLAPGRTVEQARAQVETIVARLRSEYRDTNDDKMVVSVLPATGIRFHPMLDGYVEAASVGLLVAVGLVLLIACANVASLLLARGAARTREFAIRAAIGAGRGRLAQQMLSEALVLAVAGGALGLLIAWWASRAMSGFGTNLFPMPIAFDLSIDGTVLGFAALVSLLTTILSGLMPAWTSSKTDLVPALKDAGDGPGRLTLRNALVVGQLALSLVLLVAGSLLARGLLAARQTDLGFDPRFVSSLSFNLQMNGYSPERASAFQERALDKLRTLPGVTAASVASRLPLSPDINMNGVQVAGFHSTSDEETAIDTVAVGSDYFAATSIAIVKGRAFSREDVVQQRKVAIVNETMARQFWPKGNVLGGRIYLNGFQSEPVEVIGVAKDHKVRSVGESPRPYLHLPSPASQSIGLIVRTAMPADRALPMLRQAIWSLEPEVVFTEDVTAAQVADTTMAPTRIGLFIFGAFGLLALVLATVGLYGVIAYAVARRTREVGIRMALGARRGQVLRLILWQGGRLALVAVILGTGVAAVAGRLLQALLYGVSSFDPLAFGIAVGILLLVAAAANLAPALTAARIDPLRALRTE